MADLLLLPEALRLTPTERIMAWRLLEPRTISIDEYIEALYADRDDGGPLDARGSICAQLLRVRNKLRPFGVTLVTQKYHGWYVPADQEPALRALLSVELQQMHRFAPPACKQYDDRQLSYGAML